MRSIQWRVVGIYLLMIVLAMVMVSVYLLNQWEDYYLQGAQQDLEFRGRMLRDQELINENDLIEAAALLGYSTEEGSNLVVLNQLMQAIVVYGPDIGIRPGHSLLENRPVSDLLAHPEAPGPFVERFTRDGVEYLAMAIRTGGRVDGQTVSGIFLLQPLVGIYSLLGDMQDTLLKATFFAMVVVTVLGLAFARTITQPIVEITSTAEKLATGQFDISVAVRSQDEIGRLAEVFNYLTDQLRQSLNAMANEKSKLEAILAHMSNGVVAFDRSGQLIHINPKARELLAMPEQPSPEQVLHRLKLGTVADVLANAPGIAELHLEQPPVVLRAYLAPFSSSDDQLSGVVVVLQDMTEQWRLDQMGRDFVANVSHELKTPLTTIMSYTETLLDGALDDRANAVQFLSTVYSEADRMDRLVKDLLMLSALDSQKAAEMSPLLLDELIVEVMDRLLVSAHQNEQRLSSQLPEELPWVLGNRDQLEQVLVNILSNAIKYTPAGGEITVSLRTEQQKVVVEVADSGIGIPAAELPRLFERFYRVDKARSREMGGTGLGLPIAKEIVENHHGEIWVESEIGRGTRVCFALPIAATSKGGRVSA